jgi:hypothetical protein
MLQKREQAPKSGSNEEEEEEEEDVYTCVSLNENRTIFSDVVVAAVVVVVTVMITIITIIMTVTSRILEVSGRTGCVATAR